MRYQIPVFATSPRGLRVRMFCSPLPWSDRILDEVERNLPKLGVNPVQAKRRVSTMRGAFGAESLVDGFDALAP